MRGGNNEVFLEMGSKKIIDGRGLFEGGFMSTTEYMWRGWSAKTDGDG